MKRFCLLILWSIIGTLMLSTPAIGSKATRQADIELPFGERSIMSERAIRERTAPSGAVCLEGETCGEALVVAHADGHNSEGRNGETVYQTFCMACHANAVGGAPKTHDKDAWVGRKNLASVINGLGIMPARGGCADCSDEELQSAIDFMSE